MNDAGALVIGGGLAGSAAAIVLARAGQQVVLLEKQREAHHKVCGEFLSGEALHYLALLGVDAHALGAVAIGRVRVGSHTSRLPFAAMSLTRKRLDEDLLRVAAAAGVDVRRGARVDALEPDAEGWRAQFAGASLHANAAFLASGKHDLRGWPRPPGEQSDLLGFKMYFRLRPAQREQLAGSVELHPFPFGYAGLQPVEDGAANLCCVLQRTRYKLIGGDWQQVLAEMREGSALLRRRLEGAEPLLEHPLAVGAIPYGFVREDALGPALFAIGDQAAVIPSFTGDGMSIALHSGVLAAQMHLRGETARTFQRTLHAQVSRQVSFATRISQRMVSPLLQRLAPLALRLWPGTLGSIAQRTRLPSAALQPSTKPWSSPT